MPLQRIACTTVVALLLAAVAAAAPAGEQVVLGDVSFHRDGSVTVIHASDGAVIHYDSFDIFANEVVQFIQPGEQARVLNRVFGDATHIEGALLANGIVYIVNPAGIFVGGDAVVEVGGLVAAAGNITNEDFLAGIDRFELTGPVENRSPDVRADTVALLGTRVENFGEIRAQDGVIALVAGERVVLVRLAGRVHVEVDGGPAIAGDTGVRQAGLVDAGGGQAILAVGDHYSLAINHEGVTRGADVELRGGDDGTLLVRGEIDASGDEQGGDIRITGDRVALVGARLDASGGAGGGDIRLGGDVRGEGELPTARRVYVDGDSQLVADAIDSGDGGSVVVWGDEVAVVEGSISARGGTAGGDGGFAEISSLGLLVADGEVDLGADAGASGTLLFDPQDILIMGGTADGSDDPDASEDVLNGGTLGSVLFADLGDGSTPFVIRESEIEGTDANIVLEARNSIGVSGTFDNDAGEGVGVVVVSDGNDLTLRTRNDTDDEMGSAATPGIDLGSLTWRTSGGGDITIATGSDGASGGGTGAAADIAVGDLSTGGGGGSVTLATKTGSITAGAIDTSGADAATGTAGGEILVSTVDGSITVASADASGGDGTSDAGGAGGRIVLQAGDGGVAGEETVLVTGDLVSLGGDAAAAGSASGGQGGIIEILTQDGDVTAAGIDTSGGDGGMADPGAPGRGGDAGALFVDAGEGEGVGGSITLTGGMRAVDGAGAPASSEANGVRLIAIDALEFSGVAGPQITTSEELVMRAASIGAVTPIEVESDGTLDQRLEVVVSDEAHVDVTTPGFSVITVGAEGHGANLDVIQAAEKNGGNGVTIEIVGGVGANTIQRIDTTQIDDGDTDTVGTPVGVLYQQFDELDGDDDVGLQAVVASGAITAASGITILSEDDVVLEDGAIAMHEVLDPDAFSADPPEPAGTGETGLLEIRADFDEDGSGAILAGGAGTAIDMDPDGVDSLGRLAMSAGSGIGAAGAPIVTANLDEVSAGTTTSGGVHLRNVAGGDVSLVAGLPADPFGPNGAVVVADAGAGDIDVTNDAGDLLVRGAVRAAGSDMVMGSGGSIALAVTDPDAAIRFLTAGGSLVEAAGGVTLDGDVELGTHTEVDAGGDVTFAGAVDSDAAIQVVRDLTVTSGGVVRFGGDVGSQLALRNLAVNGATELAQDTSFTAALDVAFDAVDAAADDAAGLTVVAGSASFSGDLGAGGRLRGVAVDSDAITFDGDADQTVAAGADGIALNPAGLAAPPPRANIGKSGGDLRLDTTGALDIGPNQKLTVEGTAVLVGASVTVGDVSAQAIEVESDDFQIRAREGAPFQLAGGGLVPDTGPDLIANTISTTSAPVAIGSGNPPVFATVSGGVDGAGAGSVQVVRLRQPVTPADLVDTSGAAPVFFDLGVAVTDPGHETPEPPPPVEDLQPARPGDEAAGGSALAPGPDAVLEFLRCAETQGESSARACAPAPGSPLDSERGDEIAQRHARLFGPSPEAQAARRLLAGADSPERQAVLRDLVTLLAQLRLLGMDAAGYQRVRNQLLDEALAGGSRDALLADIRAHARGIPL